MEYKSTAKYIKFSPYKLRPLVDEVRGESVQSALNWLSTQAFKRVLPITKVIESAVANAKQLENQQVEDLVIRAKTATIPGRTTEPITSEFIGMKQFFPGKPSFTNTFEVSIEELKIRL